MIMDQLKKEIKEVIISSLQLEDLKPENIEDSAALFGDGLGLDSIDALELGVALKKKFGVKFSAESLKMKFLKNLRESLFQNLSLMKEM